MRTIIHNLNDNDVKKIKYKSMIKLFLLLIVIKGT